MDHIIKVSSTSYHYQGKIEEIRFIFEMENNDSMLVVVKKDKFNGKEEKEILRVVKEKKIKQNGTYILEENSNTDYTISKTHSYNIDTTIPYLLLEAEISPFFLEISTKKFYLSYTIDKNNIEKITSNEEKHPKFDYTNKVRIINEKAENIMFRKEFTKYGNKISFIEEIKCLLKLRGSEHISNLKYIQLDKKNGLVDAIIIEHYKVCLEELIPKLKRKDLELKLKIALDLCTALEFIQSRGIYHLDIKPSNIMLTDNLCKVKIIDFGMSYTPGRYIQGEKPEKNVVYALGITLLELSLGKNIEILDKEILLKFLGTIRKYKTSYTAILGCLNLKFKLKTVKEVINKHPFLNPPNKQKLLLNDI